MSNLHLVSAAAHHLGTFMPDIRPLDNEEWVAGTGMRTKEAIGNAIQYGAAWAVVDNAGVCWALWGVAPKFPHGECDTGVAWMVASRKAARNLHSMHRLFRKGISDMHARYHHLEAWAYGRNTLHHVWMERFGWTRTGQVANFATPLSFIQYERTQV